jgi:geranyl-CoA carboxylase beta subunit
MVVVNDAGIGAGAMQNLTGRKIMRCQEIALANKLPFIQLVESAGGNLRSYRVDRFIAGGGMFRNLARLSAAGLPVLAVVHGSSTAGGAYLPGLSDHVVMVRGRARAFLAGPPLLKAATGEIATEEELGGADMHGSISGLADHLADDDAQALSMLREVVRGLDWNRARSEGASRPWRAPRLDAEDIAGLMPLSSRQPVTCASDRPAGRRFRTERVPSRLRPGHRLRDRIPAGHATAFITNNGPLDPQGSTKAAQFIQLCDQAGTPIVYLQNTTGFIVGRASEEAGMIACAKLIQALTNARAADHDHAAPRSAPATTACAGARSNRDSPSWPNAKSAVMGASRRPPRWRWSQAGQRRGKPLISTRSNATGARSSTTSSGNLAPCIPAGCC